MKKSIWFALFAVLVIPGLSFTNLSLNTDINAKRKLMPAIEQKRYLECKVDGKLLKASDPGLMILYVPKKKEVTIWGSGSPRREFLFSDDLADACRFLFQMAREDFDALLAAEPPIVNVGSDQELTIKELAELVSNTLGLECNFVWDGTKPDGTPRKLLSGQKLAALGWRPKTLLADGIKHTYDVFVRQS